MASADVVLLEAPGGYGKSTAWQSWSRSLDLPTIGVALRSVVGMAAFLSSLAGAARRSGLPLIADSIEPDAPDASLSALLDRLAAADAILLAVDESQRLDSEGAAWLADLAVELPQGHRLGVSGRRLAPRLRELPQRLDATLLTANDLRFDLDETRALLVATRVGESLPDEEFVRSIHRATGGWPAALVVAAQSNWESDDKAVASLAPGGGVLRTLVERLVHSGPDSLRGELATISQLPLISTEVAEAVCGPGALDRLLEAGLPVTFRTDGWAELPDAVREVAGSATLSVEQARLVANLYATRGELAEACSLLSRRDDHEGIALLIGSQPRESLARAGLPIWDAIVAEIPDEILRSNPGVLVQLIRAADPNVRQRERWLARARVVVNEASPEGRAIAAERARDMSRSGDLKGALAVVEDVLAAAAPDEVVTIGRAQLCRGLCLVVADTGSNVETYRESFELAASRFRLALERDWEAEALLDLGYGVWFTSGALTAAAQTLEEALALRAAPDALRAETLVCLAEVLGQVGRLDDAAVAVREARAIGQRLADERALGFTAWTSAQIAAASRDREAALAALEEAERHPGSWFGALPGIDFLSDAAEIRAVVGDVDGAWRDLSRAESRAAGTAREGEPLSARVRLEAMFGDAQKGLALADELDVSPFAHPKDRWLTHLFRSACLARLGSHEQALTELRQARHMCAEVDDPERPQRREPELLALVEPDAAAPEALTTIVTLGRFAVERAGQDITPLPGRPQTLVKMLAVRGQLALDEAVEELWPEIDEETGRARLRNLLNRIRSAAGELVVRADGAVSIAPGVQVDAHRFEQEAAAALSAPLSTRPGLARAALTRSTGELLPADKYADWATVPRERLRRRQLALIDVVSEDALARGDFDEADRLLDEAISLDPLDEVRYVRLARALIGQGRVRRAHRVAEQALSVASELGAEPTDELATLLRELEISLP